MVGGAAGIDGLFSGAEPVDEAGLGLAGTAPDGFASCRHPVRRRPIATTTDIATDEPEPTAVRTPAAGPITAQ
jgi:hypothetical protein